MYEEASKQAITVSGRNIAYQSRSLEYLKEYLQECRDISLTRIFRHLEAAIQLPLQIHLVQV